MDCIQSFSPSLTQCASEHQAQQVHVLPQRALELHRKPKLSKRCETISMEHWQKQAYDVVDVKAAAILDLYIFDKL